MNDMYRIRKEHHFSASHRLEGVPEGHPCGRLHGHNYVVEVVLEAEELDEAGFVRDFGDLDVIFDWIDDTLDHRHLNDVLPDDTPTSAEGIARYIYQTFGGGIKECVAVRVSETPKSWATYRPDA